MRISPSLSLIPFSHKVFLFIDCAMRKSMFRKLMLQQEVMAYSYVVVKFRLRAFILSSSGLDDRYRRQK